MGLDIEFNSERSRRTKSEKGPPYLEIRKSLVPFVKVVLVVCESRSETVALC